MIIPDKQDKFIAILSIIFGLFSFLPIIIKGLNVFIINSSNILARFFLVTLFINGGLLFIAAGLFIYFGVIVPNVSDNATIHERAKTNIFFIIGSTPFLLSATTAIFLETQGILWKIAWFMLILWLISSLLSSINTIKWK